MKTKFALLFLIAAGFLLRFYGSSGNKNYEIILEYRPQRLFYLGFFVTLLVLMGGLYYYLLLMRKQKMKT